MIRATSCGRCGTRYDGHAFGSLAPVERLDRDALAAIVVRWPEGTTVEVRACAKCARPIARLTRQAGGRA
ncbi:hypothetical protein AKJ09_09668 [Labilithrix luteola]|uniref:Uncharacterized protein n=1 Tax=Labilithrix luteola TaxID=1391654 RepID=A0A0K1QC44_9BACT|nr:hypothetical protein [Labilithrix luteola]AKV03005.1 hypothetical protein AKJ09_09668 [Labilithrix luteola]